MQKNIYEVIAWGRVVVNNKEFYLLAPKPYHSEMEDGKVGHSVWQPESTLKWEVADRDDFSEFDTEVVFNRSIIIFGQNALIEFYQDPHTIKVNYIVPEDDDDNDVAIAPTN